MSKMENLCKEKQNVCQILSKRLTESVFSLKMGAMKQNNMKKILEWIFAILKGTLVGLAIVIPGVSGGSMLLTIGVYQDVVSITSRDKAVRSKAIVKLIPYALGIVLGVAGLSFVITWLLANYELYTILTFCGLILGSLPMLIKEIRGQIGVKRISPFYLLLSALTVALMIALPLLGSRASERFERLTAADPIALNDRIILSESGAADETLTVRKDDPAYAVLKVKSAQSGLSGMRADLGDGVMLEYDALDDTYWNETPVLLQRAGDAVVINGMSYTAYRAVDTLNNGFVSALWAAALGFIAAGTMIVPGISGSMVLLVLGFYNSVMSHLKGAIVALVTLDFAALPAHLLVLIPFAIGMVLGLLIVSKAIKWLLDRFPTPTYYAIIGLMLASPFAIFMKSSLISSTFLTSLHWYTVVIGLVCLAAGFIAALNLSDEKKE